MTPLVLVGRAVQLDALRADDADAIVAADDELTRLAWGRSEQLSVEAAAGLIEKAASGWQTGAHFWFAVRRRPDPAYVGRLDLWPAHSGDGGRIGIIVAPQARRHGLAAEAVRLAMAFAYETLDWPFLIAEILPSNLPSRRLAESLGFQFQGGPYPTSAGAEALIYLRHRDGPAVVFPPVSPRRAERSQ